MARRVTIGAACLTAAFGLWRVEGAPWAAPGPAAPAPSTQASAAPSASAAAKAAGSATPDAPAAPKERPDPALVLPARPPTVPPPEPVKLPWEHHIDFGPDLAFVTPPASKDDKGRATGVHYASTFGFAAHATYPMLSHLQLSVYFFDSNHGLRFDPGALGVPGQIRSDSVHTYSFGLRLQPMIPISDRARAWVSGGIGWARWDFPRMEVTNGPGVCPENTYRVTSCYMLYERNNNMAVFPLGVGASIDLVRHRLAAVLELTAAVPAFQSGSAISPTRAVDDDGINRDVGGLPKIDLMLVETLGLSLVL